MRSGWLINDLISSYVLINNIKNVFRTAELTSGLYSQMLLELTRRQTSNESIFVIAEVKNLL